MPSANDIIATTGTTTPTAAFSLGVRSEEVFSAVELIVGLRELLFESGEGDVVEVSRVAPSVGGGTDVTLITCTRSDAMISTGSWFPLQLEKPRYEPNRDVALDPKAAGSVAVGLMIDSSGRS